MADKGFESGTAGLEAPTLPLCHVVPPVVGLSIQYPKTLVPNTQELSS